MILHAAARAWTNGCLLYGKITAFLASAAPSPRAKKFVLNAAGTSAGITAALVQLGRRRRIKEYLRAVFPEGNPAATATACIVQAGRDLGWDIVARENPALIAGLIDISDWAPIKKALDRGRGAVMIGAHYGPSFNTQTFAHAGSLLNATVLLSEAAVGSKKNMADKAAKFLRTKPDPEDPVPERLALAGLQERILVEKIRAGGSVYVNCDIPRDEGGVPAEIFGRKVFLSGFAFKLAIKYGAPVYFCGSKTDGKGSYKWLATEATAFATADEGARLYADWLNGLIIENPALWHGLRFYG